MMIHITDIHKTLEKMLQSEMGPTRYVVRYIKMLSDMAFTKKKKTPAKSLKLHLLSLKNPETVEM